LLAFNVHENKKDNKRYFYFGSLSIVYCYNDKEIRSSFISLYWRSRL